MIKVPIISIHGAFVIEPQLHHDSRGFFYESWNEDIFRDLVGDPFLRFVQDNQSNSLPGVIRGLHYQSGEAAQGKLVSVSLGAIFDVIVDLRENSPTFKQWAGVSLSGDNHESVWVPPGCAHGFLVTSETPARVHYKVTGPRIQSAERTLRWDDPTLNIPWPQKDQPFILSEKDSHGVSLDKCETYKGVSWV